EFVDVFLETEDFGYYGHPPLKRVHRIRFHGDPLDNDLRRRVRLKLMQDTSFALWASILSSDVSTLVERAPFTQRMRTYFTKLLSKAPLIGLMLLAGLVSLIALYHEVGRPLRRHYLKLCLHCGYPRAGLP